LRKETPDEAGEYETHPDRMAQMARNYHETLQREGIPVNEEERTRKNQMSEKVLRNITTHLTEEQQAFLGQILNRVNVVSAILNG
jgi:DNA-binding transcriptional regulator YbjK